MIHFNILAMFVGRDLYLLEPKPQVVLAGTGVTQDLLCIIQIYDSNHTCTPDAYTNPMTQALTQALCL